MKRTALLLGLGFSSLVACVSGCSATTTSSSDGSYRGAGDEGAGIPSASAPDPGGAIPRAPSSQGGAGGVQAGTLTAGVWDDNRNFDSFAKLRAKLAQTDGIPVFDPAEQTAAKDHALAQQGPRAKLDVQIVIDTTGSMGDEITYLDKEFDELTTSIAAKFPNADQHWSLVAYRDVGDAYVVLPIDFEADLTNLHSKLSTLEAGGGGDVPESPEKGLAAGVDLAWRSDADVAKVIFWVADAPHHGKDAPAMVSAVRAARDKGIHVYPVASSGIDELTEYTMRASAQLTGGRYLFLTDDSGVGESHEVPSIPCYFVTKLNDAIVRMVDIELSGTYHEPSADQILRKGGDPKSGACRIGESTFSVY